MHTHTHTQYTSWASSLYNHDLYSRWCEGHNCLGWNLFSASCGQRQGLPEELNCKVVHSHGKGAKRYRQRNMRKTDSRSQKWIIEAGKLQENPALEWHDLNKWSKRNERLQCPPVDNEWRANMELNKWYMHYHLEIKWRIETIYCSRVFCAALLCRSGLFTYI